MKQPATFLYEHDTQGIATITLNRPERLNALTFEVYRELTDTFAALRDERDVRVVVITGAGRAFCSGGDVHDIIGELFQRDMQGLLEFTRLTCKLIRNMRALRMSLQVSRVNSSKPCMSRWNSSPMMSCTSPPEQNARPAPVITTTRTSRSSRNAANVSVNSR